MKLLLNCSKKLMNIFFRFSIIHKSEVRKECAYNVVIFSFCTSLKIDMTL